MKITRQVALVAAPPLVTTAAVGAFGALGAMGAQTSLLIGAATAALMGLAAGASWAFSRPLVKKAAQPDGALAAGVEEAFHHLGFDRASVALMTVDRDLIVTEVNDATRKLLSDNAETFRRIWPSFRADKIVGTCIDMFHKDPSHQRQLLSDPSRLPYKTEITIDEFRFALHVHAVFDAKGDYVGNVLEWDDVTQARLQTSMLDALDRSQATIEFTLDGTVVKANENFLGAVGYSLDQIRGRHHSMFVEKEYAASPDYQRFWDEIRQGKYHTGEFKRIGNGGKEIWIQAAYNPVLDGNGKPFKVMKFATDITADVEARERRAQEQSEKAAYQERVLTSILGGLRELSNASDDLSKRTENQAATLEETAAALDQITATVKQSAETATEAHSAAAGAQKAANESGQIVGETVSAMGEIEKSSKQISQIIGVIDDIAFQTNLLALNAGVEAARAGDAGRGFAVVAQEVRALAQRSSDAAKEIKTLITTSSQQVETGADLVGRAGKALQEIVERVGSINNFISSIAASSKEQADSLAEANSAVNNLDQVTQQNAAMVEESTAACHSLTQDATELMSHVSGQDPNRIQLEGAQAGTQADGQSVADQQRRAVAFLAAANGSAALKVQPEAMHDDWKDF